MCGSFSSLSPVFGLQGTVIWPWRRFLHELTASTSSPPASSDSVMLSSSSFE
eukprot:CAMPEP_0195068466 /NCGR_PEP_ID=MMETSP0448-20130528/13177_1 /TAXON_ID=66468 /ORGANISM="Heterocapsa triquestra, Strain CCMP 448" /LENGTH=51 /DNA_ID=CAMNT_0040099997 /DNA_START=164 /DNA_END=319 /DNA_ORIENTATION=-